MRWELSDVERTVLLEVLRERLGELREEIYHSTVSTFTDELKERKAILMGMVEKLEAETADTPAG